MQKSFRIVLLILFVLFAAVLPAHAQSKSLEWKRLDTDIAVQPNGDLRINETNVINFTDGAFTFGFRDIDTSRMTGLSNIRVTENGQPLRVETSKTDDGKTRIKYYFTPARDQERTFVTSFDVKGATRIYPEGDQVYWAGVYADRSGFPVLNSRITLSLPNGAPAQKVAVYGPQADVQGTNESRVVATAKEIIPSGKEFELRVQFPHGVVSATAPPWQKAFDAQREFDEKQKPVFNLGFLTASLLLLLGGPAAVVVLYNRKGKDPNVGLVAEYLTEPPDIKPGIAGTLIDEKVDMQDILATLVDLARRGVLTMTEEAPDKTLGYSSGNYTFGRGPQFDSAQLAGFEKVLVDAIGLDQFEARSLASLKNKFFSSLPRIRNEMYEELQRDGLYNHNPEAVRNNYTALAVAVLFFALAFGCVAMFVLWAISDVAICLPVGMGVTALALFVVARHMPARTRKGADLKMRSEAFKRYLQNMEKYENLKEAKERFDKYLPFAVAFGLERTFINKFSQADAPVPDWYVPYPRPIILAGGYPNTSRGVGGSVSKGGGLGDITGAAQAGGGGLSGLDRSLTGGLAGMSAGLTTMFASVGTAFQSVPAPVSSGSSWSSGGGGWSGGGGGGGGSSGGGGGGFG